MRALTSNEMEFLSEAAEAAVMLAIPEPYCSGEDGCDYYTEKAQDLFNKVYDEIEHSYITLIILE
jgi:hypothetical protein